LPDNHSSIATYDLSDRGYFFFSPSLSDTTHQEALEVQALTLEPLSGHQFDPVVVCDFTALYPSLIIAYNLCYSTIAGRLDYQSTRAEMCVEGKTTGKIGPIPYDEATTAAVVSERQMILCRYLQLIFMLSHFVYHWFSKKLNHHVQSLFDKNKSDRAYVSPTGSIYVSETVVKGVLPQVLDEILSTRAMLKKAAKYYKKHVTNLSPSILRQLEARQLALKYVANVTYGKIWWSVPNLNSSGIHSNILSEHNLKAIHRQRSREDVQCHC
jgi:DNA polymerase zeta